MLKICPHRYLGGYDVSVWVDGNIKVIGDIRRFVEEYDLSKTPLYTRIHPSRNCIYAEAEAIVEAGKDTPDAIEEIIRRYKEEGYPKKIGLAETNVLLRRHNSAKCVLFDNAWAAEVLLHSHRDQMSFNYAAWKTRFTPGYLTRQFKINENEYFRLMPHGHVNG